MGYGRECRMEAEAEQAVREHLSSARRSHKTWRDNTWETKDGKKIKYRDMTEKHLYHAYNKTGNQDLFREMVLRVYEAMFISDVPF